MLQITFIVCTDYSTRIALQSEWKIQGAALSGVGFLPLPYILQLLASTCAHSACAPHCFHGCLLQWAMLVMPHLETVTPQSSWT